ncbi:MAG: threonylcarbamoyl-AMP synthase [Prevotellaceae bacterium]|jgi:L-threonylcarbamoyladenylate synthase|nr:threonylcarbamoyl-AMP synthase [Prevotellaceae bacterium]
MEGISGIKLIDEIVTQTLEVLQRGGLLLYPTDTLWGIGCDATNEQAVEKIFALKQRTESKSLILLADSMAMVERYVQQVPGMAYSLVEVALQPLTIIYPQAAGLAPNATAADGSVAIRVVQHDFCKALLRRFKKPVVSTSANVSGTPAPATFRDIADAIKQDVDFIVPALMDKGATGKPSSILKLGLTGEVEVIRQ